uniref:Ribosome-associated translation inhibitor RaiA n=1 Tax=Eiseniibacteriota bacterium TaxID=2212470 RepID=A0A832HZY3_UNCEI
MQISTTARHCDLDPQTRQHATQRLSKLERFARDIHEAHLVVTAEKFRHVAEITLRLNAHELVSREASNEPRIAIDLAADRLEAQLRRLKERRLDRGRGPRPDTAGEGAAPAGDGLEEA